ncbi:hypothetical protein ACFSX9_11155 [Flavobacterium ardleyense]|uniref:Uncharacterized protein n=1 Tax=Flavobacterium ardleyense TaxID=2038737 RepID=A0ABW5Z8S8_9FLAO
MKLFCYIIVFFTLTSHSQEHKIEMISKYDYAELGTKKWALESFQGIEKLDISFTNSEKLIGKNFKIIIRKYKKGKIEIEKTVIDTKSEGLPTIGKDFKFSIVSQQLLNSQKLAFFFSNFNTKQIFDVNKKFKDGSFLLRDVSGSEDDKGDFTLGKETQIGLITPPNLDPSKGNLGYCEVSKGNIDVAEWYQKYKISEFFLLYILIEE